MQRGLVGSEMCIRDRYQRRVHGKKQSQGMIMSKSKREKAEREEKEQREKEAHFNARLEELGNIINENLSNPPVVLRELFMDLPYRVKDEAIKDNFTVIFLMMMNAMKLEDVKAFIGKLTDAEAYAMIKLICLSWKRIGSGLQKVDKYCRSDILFKAHTHIVQKLGQSVIGRLLSDANSLQSYFKFSPCTLR
eukprot:TRINITY_DN4696_c0_g1_i1.p1 TRINITY_DN4696_c0_g1~~TRINITY_DN4696_c0_g1_i1.p1  ORF type:complete len:192 (+),score=39.29 TRINITY_DN4696_c0_g1_i1:121-696(+)